LSACDQAFALFKGTRSRGIYDNMKTAVETIFVGKDRRYNRRFLIGRRHTRVPVAARRCVLDLILRSRADE
jgi:hypothetical protein